MVICRIELASERIRLIFDRTAITNWLVGAAPPEGDADLHIIELPLSVRRRGVGRRLVIEGQAVSLRRPDQPLIDMVARACLSGSAHRRAGA